MRTTPSKALRSCRTSIYRLFDCAFKPAKGTRSIPWQAHVQMMAAAQPFLSGAISKTVNMPNDVSPKDIADAYFWGWELGLKAIAIYRDGSKQSQPLNTKSEGDKAADKAAAVTEKIVTSHVVSAYRTPVNRSLTSSTLLATKAISMLACTQTVAPASCSLPWPKKDRRLVV